MAATEILILPAGPLVFAREHASRNGYGDLKLKARTDHMRRVLTQTPPGAEGATSLEIGPLFGLCLATPKAARFWAADRRKACASAVSTRDQHPSHMTRVST